MVDGRVREGKPSSPRRGHVQQRTSATGPFSSGEDVSPACPDLIDRMLTHPDRPIRKPGRRCARLHRMRILVVEDEVDLAHTLHTGLTAEGYSVDLAHDGRQGLWMARTGEYALVV